VKGRGEEMNVKVVKQKAVKEMWLANGLNTRFYEVEHTDGKINLIKLCRQGNTITITAEELQAISEIIKQGEYKL
jgi:hypothetical protein